MNTIMEAPAFSFATTRFDNRLFGRLIDDFLRDDLPGFTDFQVKDVGSKYVLTIPVPGFNRKNIRVEIGDYVMQVIGERSDCDRNVHRDHASSLFLRSFQLPADADEKTITAKCRDGLLTLEIGKINMKRNHRVIPVEGENNVARVGRPRSWHDLGRWIRNLLK